MATIALQWPNPPHVESLVANAREVLGLVRIHSHLTGRGPGRRRNVEVLNKSAIVLLVACWEAYIEDLAIVAFDALLDGADEPGVLPVSVLTLTAKSIRESQDERAVWKLAGGGWRDVLQQHRDATVARYVGKLNTPKPDQINELIERMCGFKNIASVWKWKGSTASTNRARLENLVALRGQIAHRLRAAQAVQKRDVIYSAHFIHRLAVMSSNALAVHIHKHIGEFPWRKVSYGAAGLSRTPPAA